MHALKPLFWATWYTSYVRASERRRIISISARQVVRRLVDGGKRKWSVGWTTRRAHGAPSTPDDVHTRNLLTSALSLLRT